MANKINIVISAEDKASKPVRQVADEVSRAAGTVSSSTPIFENFGRVAGMAVAAGFAAVSAGALAASKASFDQVKAVEEARFGLNAYERDASKVNTVLSQLVAYAKSDTGVLFNRKDLFIAASTLKMYGDATGDLTRHVEILSKGVAQGKTTFQELSGIVGRAAAKSRLDAVDFDMLIERGIGLDKSFRGAAVTSGELWQALDKAIPDQTLAGRAQTIEGRMIRMQSAFRGVGDAILGVDPITNNFIENGLGDRFMKAIETGTKLLKDFGPAVRDATRWLLDLSDKTVGRALPALGEFGKQVGDYLGPKLTMLWQIVTEKLAPALYSFWKDVIEPQIPAIGTFFVGAVGALIEVLGLGLNAISGVINFLSQNQWIIWGAVAAFVGFKSAMLISETVLAFQAGMAAAAGANGVGLLSSRVSGLAAMISAPMVMPAIGIAAALAAIAIVYQKTVELKQTLDSVGNQIEANRRSGDQTDAAVKKMYEDGRISLDKYNEYLRNTEKNTNDAKSRMYTGFFGPMNKAFDDLAVRLSGNEAKFKGSGFGGHALGTNYSPGGTRWVGEQGPELINVPRGAEVMPAYRAQSQHGGGQSSINIANLNINNTTDYKVMLSDMSLMLRAYA